MLVAVVDSVVPLNVTLQEVPDGSPLSVKVTLLSALTVTDAAVELIDAPVVSVT
jgi:hypothetical protein